MKFQWDPSKAASNISKHGVSFDEAMTVFKDPLALIFDDTIHSENEFREIIGFFVERQEDVVRIISARPATKQEIKDYEGFARSQKH